MMTFLFIVLLLVLAGIIYYHLVKSYYEIPYPADETHFIKTADNAKIVLHRYLPPEGFPKYEPIILCHGLSASRANVDLNETYSLARYFNRIGYDSWVIELRAAGMSSQKNLNPGFKKPVTFDDFVRFDLPAAIYAVRKKTGQDQIHWIGHSMGGMVIHAYLQKAENAKNVKSFVAIASPVMFGFPKELKSLFKVGRSLMWFPNLRLKVLGIMSAPFARLLRKIPSQFFRNMDRMELKVLKQCIANVSSDAPVSLLKQFIDWSLQEKFISRDGDNYFENLPNNKTPALLIAGSRDLLVPPSLVKLAYEKLGSADKTFITFGTKYNHAQDYGHLDLVLSPNALNEVFPVIRDWILNHSQGNKE